MIAACRYQMLFKRNIGVKFMKWMWSILLIFMHNVPINADQQICWSHYSTQQKDINACNVQRHVFAFDLNVIVTNEFYFHS